MSKIVEILALVWKWEGLFPVTKTYGWSCRELDVVKYGNILLAFQALESKFLKDVDQENSSVLFLLTEGKVTLFLIFKMLLGVLCSVFSQSVFVQK